MIQTIAHYQIDFAQYDACLAQDPHRRLYAQSFYLNLVAKSSWKILVLNDYEAVMPIPFQKILGISVVSQPVFCQQLGIFGANMTEEVEKKFQQKLAKKIVRGYNLPCTQVPTDSPFQLSQKRNQTLDLSKPYNQLFAAYSGSKKKDLRRGKNAAWTTQPVVEFENMLALFATEFPTIYQGKTLQIFREILQTFQQKQALLVQAVLSQSQQIMGYVVLLQDGNRWVQIAQVKDKKIQENGCMTFLLDSVIQRFTNTQTILDFEGSSIPGVAKFNAGFGAQEEWFCSIKSKILR